MAEKDVIRTDRAPGPFQGAPYNQAIRVGDLVFVAGQLGISLETGALAGSDVATQTEQIMANLAAILHAAGSGLDKLVKTTVFLMELGDFAAMNEVYAAHVGIARPLARRCRSRACRAARSSRSRRSRTSESPVVRAATVSDARGILDVRARSWQVAYAHVFPAEQLARLTEDADGWITWWEETISAPELHTHVLVVERAASVVGFAHLGSARDGEPDTAGELYAIYVDPSWWGEGVGRALMSESLRRLRAEGFEQAMLWVLEDNPRTRTFYELSGWHVDGAAKDEEWLGTRIHEVRYRITL